MARPSVTPFLILLVVLISAVTAARANMPQKTQMTVRKMVSYLLKTRPLQHNSESEEWNWTVRPRNAADLHKPMTRSLTKLKMQCWTYFGHPQTIRDVKSFFKWGCQPYPITCDGINALPKECLASMFYTIKNVRAPQVKELYSRCNLKVRPIEKKTGRYVSYCQDMINVVQAKIELLAKKQGQY